jgi:antitoxin HicB
MRYGVPLVFSLQPEGGFTVTSPVLPELVSESDTLDEAYETSATPMPQCWKSMRKSIPRFRRA